MLRIIKKHLFEIPKFETEVIATSKRNYSKDNIKKIEFFKKLEVLDKSQFNLKDKHIFKTDKDLMESKQITKKFNSVILEEVGSEKVNSITGSLPVVAGIQKSLDKKNVAVVYGPPGSGKTEQMELAVGGKPTTFDLKNEFLAAYFTENKIPENEQDRIWKEGYYNIKDKELEWLEKNYDVIKDKLLSGSSNTIALDEFDMGKTTTLDPTEVKTAKLILRLAQDCVDNGKQVVMIVHPTGLNTDDLKNAFIEGDFISSDKDVTYTGRLIPEETQKEILSELGIEGNEAKELIAYIRGNPAAYLEFFKMASSDKMTKTTYINFKKQAYDRVVKNWNLISTIENPEVISLLQEIALKGSKVHLHTMTEIKKKALETGLVFEKDGVMQMSNLVKGVISDDSTLNRNPVFKEKVVSITKASEVIHLESKQYIFMPSFAEYIKARGGGLNVVETSKGKHLLIPYNPSFIDNEMNIKKGIITSHIVSLRLPEEKLEYEHYNWKNDAKTIDELHALAERVAPPFLKVIDNIASSTKSFTSPKEFGVKSKESMERKATLWSQFGNLSMGEAVGSLNDSLRTSIFCDNLNQFKQTVDEFNKRAKQENWKVVYSNKFNENYSTGYIGLHAKVVITSDTGDKKIMGEVQFHFRTIHDGTLSSIKEYCHKLYEETRTANNSKDEQMLTLVASKAGFSYGLSRLDIGPKKDTIIYL